MAPCRACPQVNYRGYFLPPRPDKNAVEAQRSTSLFVEERRDELQKYLAKLAGHPATCRSDELRVFLTAPDLSARCGQCFFLEQCFLRPDTLQPAWLPSPSP